MNTLGIVVAADKNNWHIADWSRKDVAPIRVEKDLSNVKSPGTVSKTPKIEMDRFIDEGNCLLLREFFVGFDLEREGLPWLRKKIHSRDHAGTWCVWRHGSDRCIDCNRQLGAHELQEMNKLYSWWRSNRMVYN